MVNVVVIGESMLARQIMAETLDRETDIRVQAVIGAEAVDASPCNGKMPDVAVVQCASRASANTIGDLLSTVGVPAIFVCEDSDYGNVVPGDAVAVCLGNPLGSGKGAWRAFREELTAAVRSTARPRFRTGNDD